jgi:hypothetical protein
MHVHSAANDQSHGSEKAVWTDADFSVMGWHDRKVYALALVQDAEDGHTAFRRHLRSMPSSASFRQIIRREPLHVQAQHLAMEARGGISFSEAPYDGSASARSATHAANPPVIQRLEQPGGGAGGLEPPVG